MKSPKLLWYSCLWQVFIVLITNQSSCVFSWFIRSSRPEVLVQSCWSILTVYWSRRWRMLISLKNWLWLWSALWIIRLFVFKENHLVFSCHWLNFWGNLAECLFSCGEMYSLPCLSLSETTIVINENIPPCVESVLVTWLEINSQTADKGAVVVVV